jgi:hypothetical protein
MKYNDIKYYVNLSALANSETGRNTRRLKAKQSVVG